MMRAIAGKRIISIIVDTAGARRQFLLTPIFEALRRDPKNEIFIYTRNMRLKKRYKFENVHFRRFKYLRGIEASGIILLSGWQDALFDVLVMAQKRKIPTLVVQESSSSPSGGYSREIYPDSLCVWGEVSKQEYIKNGLPERIITVTGQPRFDLYFGLNGEDMFGAEKKILLFATQPLWRSSQHYPGGEEVIKEEYDHIYNSAKELDLKLVCKMHPSDKKELYERDGVLVLKDTGVSPRNVIPWYCDNGYDPDVEDLKRLGRIYLSSDIVVTLLSTTGLEAMSCGRPAIYFDMNGYHRKFNIYRILRERCSFGWAQTREELRGLLERYLKDPTSDSELRSQVVSDFLYKQDGQASKRVVEKIYELIYTDGHR